MYQELDEANSQPRTFSRRTKTVVLGFILIGAVVVGSVAAHQSKSLRSETNLRLQNDSPKNMANEDGEVKDLVKRHVNMDDQMFSHESIQSNPDATFRTMVSSAGWTHPITANGQPVLFDLNEGGKHVHRICVHFFKYIQGFELSFVGSNKHLVAGETSGLHKYCARVSGILCWGNVEVRVSPMRVPGTTGPDSQGISSVDFSYLNRRRHVQTLFLDSGLHQGGHVYTVYSNNFCLAGIKGKFTAGTLTEIEFLYS